MNLTPWNTLWKKLCTIKSFASILNLDLVQPRINLLFRKVVEEMVHNKEIDITSKYDSLNKYQLPADFKFVVLERFLSIENELSIREGLILNAYFNLKHYAESDTKAYGLDTSDVVVEKIPLVITPVSNINLVRKAIEIE